MLLKNEVNNFIKEAQILAAFKNFCINYSTYEKKKRIRNILALSPNKVYTIACLFKDEQHICLDYDDALRMLDLIIAYLNKSTFRKSIDIIERNELLFKQNNKCAICGSCISTCSHADHIVPFKYVGDELKNNMQMLCTHCNCTKRESFDYQIRYYLNLL